MLVDAMMMVQHVDGVVYVVMSDFAKRSFIFRGMEELTTNGVEVLGCILNGGKSRSQGYGYYGYYGRYSGYNSSKTKKITIAKKALVSRVRLLAKTQTPSVSRWPSLAFSSMSTAKRALAKTVLSS
jgi:Mrp family chromosome partitioning ATPase